MVEVLTKLLSENGFRLLLLQVSFQMSGSGRTFDREMHRTIKWDCFINIFMGLENDGLIDSAAIKFNPYPALPALTRSI